MILKWWNHGNCPLADTDDFSEAQWPLGGPKDCSLPDSSVHRTLQARIQQWATHSLLQGVFQTQELNQGLLHCRRILYRLSHQGSPLLWNLSLIQISFAINVLLLKYKSDRRMDKDVVHIFRVWYIYIKTYYSAIKKNEIMPFAAIWMDLEIVILSKVSQKEAETSH